MSKLSPMMLEFRAICDRLMAASACQEYRDAINTIEEWASARKVPSTFQLNVAGKLFEPLPVVASVEDADVSFFRSVYDVIAAADKNIKHRDIYFRVAFSAFFKAGCVSDSFRKVFPDDIADAVTERNALVEQIKRVLYSNTDISRLRVAYRASDRKNAVAMEFDTDEEALIAPVVDVIAHDTYKKYTQSDRIFTTHLARSIGGAIDDWEDITLDIMRRQYEYFQSCPETVPHNRSYTCQLCKMLYLRLLDRYPGITARTGVTKGLLSASNALEYIGAGYRPVTIDKLKDIPAFDDWLARLPEGTAKAGSDMSHLGHYVVISFSKIPAAYKDACKRFVWHHDIILTEKQRLVRVITQFLLFRKEHRKKVAPFRKQESEDVILPEELIAFLPPREQKNRKRLVSALRIFIRYLLDSDSGLAAYDCLKVLDSLPVKVNEKITAVPEDDFVKLADALRSDAERPDADCYDYLVYKLFILVSLTELRTASWLSLTVEDVFELHGVYHMMMTTKTSNKKKNDYVFPADIYNIVKGIIRYTEPFRREAAPEVRSLVFLSERGSVLTSYCITWHMERACTRLGIRQYRMSNLRKTYMTEVAGQISKKQGSLAGMGQIFGHKSTTTTFKYYDRPATDRRIPLVMGDTPFATNEKTAEQVVDDKDAIAPEKVVYHDCGACSKEHCTVLGYQTCLVCPYFITTPAFRENFVLRKKKLELAIHDETDEDVANRFMVALKRVNIFIKAIDERKG